MERTPVATTVAAHPWVADVVDHGGHLTVTPSPAAVSVDPEPGPLVREYLDNWKEIYDHVYHHGQEDLAEERDLSGWTTSDSGLPLPEDHMTEWIDRTVELVLRGNPGHVLELGCGTGLLLYRLHQQVSSYVGTDVSPVTVRRLERNRLPSVTVVEAAAHEAHSDNVARALEKVAGKNVRPDCVLLNSVSMHFPNADYFARVIRDAIDIVAPGGAVVLGDIRHLGLLHEYCCWLERSTDPEADATEVAERAELRARREEQLLATPEFIGDVAAQAGREVHLSVHPKTMHGDTELTRYRFDAVLHVEPPTRMKSNSIVSWNDIAVMDALTTLRELCVLEDPVEVTNIPNGVLVPDAPAAVRAAELEDAVSGTGAVVLMDPSDPTMLAVATPAATIARPALTSGKLPTSLVHEPFRSYLCQRLPEILRGYLSRSNPDQAAVDISLSLDERPPASGLT